MNINLWFARDIHTDEIVSILDAKQENKYCCPICNSEAIPKALESKKVTPHFAHIDRSKCSSEAMIHWWYKHRFIEAGDTFTIKTDEEIQFTCKSFEVEKEYELTNGTYKPDLVVHTECGNEIIFEMANTNKKKVEDYIDQWIKLGKIIVEVDVKSMVNDDKTFNALYYEGKCFNFNKRDGGYYNSIGKIKEEMIKKKAYNIQKVKNLDWFWKELFKYKLNKEDGMDDLMLSMEILINADDFYIVEKPIEKHGLEEIYSRYSKYIKSKHKDYLKNIISEFNDYEFDFSISTVHYPKFHHTFHVEVKKGKYIRRTKVSNIEILTKNVLEEIHSIEDMMYYDALHDKYNQEIESKLKYQLIYVKDIIMKEFNFNNKHNLKLTDIILDRELIKISYEYNDYFIKDFNLSIQNGNTLLYKDIQSKLMSYIHENIDVLNNLDLFVNIHNENLVVDIGEYSDVVVNVDLNEPSVKIRKGWFDTYYEYKITKGKIYNDYDKEIKNFNEFISDFYSIVHVKYIRNKRCISCGENLNMTKKDLIFFHKKEFTIPKRCKTCRQKRKKGE